MGAKKKVLIVEDDNIVRSSLERLLSESDFEIQSAETGEEGLKKFSSIHYDLILADLKLPGIDGLDMVAKMREKKDALPFIMLSAYGDGEDVLRAMKMGAIEYCRKPFDAQQILNLTNKYTQDRTCNELDDRAVSNSVEDTPEEAMKEETDLPQKSAADVTSELDRITKLLAPFVSLGRQGTGITHNLNGPLTGMMGHVELMKIKHPELGNDLDIVMGLAKKMRDSIADLQTKYENETIRKPQLLSINHILRSELAYLQSDLFDKHYIERELDLDKSVPNIKGVYADFSLAFEEILLNAIDVQREQSAAKIKVKSYTLRDHICVEISDAGPGFTPEAMENAFKPFWPETRELENGAVRIGMGLYSCKSWLEPYGVKIELSNLQPKGGQVKLTIPTKTQE